MKKIMKTKCAMLAYLSGLLLMTGAHGQNVDEARKKALTAEYSTVAEKSAKGLYPRSLVKEQVYWTSVGLDSDTENGIIDEYGTVEPKAKSGTVTPFIFLEGKLMSAHSGAKVKQGLRGDYLPIPNVAWEDKRYSLTIEPVAGGERYKDSALYVKYTIENKGTDALKGKFYLAIRPLQINPPWQYGGLSSMRKIESSQGADGHQEIRVNDTPWLLSLDRAAGIGIQAFSNGDIVESLKKGQLPPVHLLASKGDRVSAALGYDFDLKGGEKKSVVISLPMHGNFADAKRFITGAKSSEEAHQRQLETQETYWKERLERASLKVPDEDINNTLKAQIGYILINRDKHSSQPGSRNYKRAWIRDGSLTSAALLRFGHVDEVRHYLDWYAKRVTPEGWVPPILENSGEINKGFGWDLEWDSQGEFVYAIMEFYRFTHDRSFLEKHYKTMVRAMEFTQKLRERTMVKGYMSDHAAPERFYGILPKSISHEGYHPPMHSYWDDYLALKGWKDVAAAAEILGDDSRLKWANEQTLALRNSLHKSIASTLKHKKIDFIPGCAEKGDDDATSVAISFFPSGEAKYLDQKALRKTFSDYCERMLLRKKKDWVGDFTPYENRSILALTELGMMPEAEEVLNMMMIYRRPIPWLHWAEVVHSDARKGGYIGDMPHTWVGAGFVNSIRGIIVQEQGDDLHLFRGTFSKWFRGEGIQLEQLPTYMGRLSLKASATDDVFEVDFTTLPKGVANIVVYCPWETTQDSVQAPSAEKVTVEGRKITLTGPVKSMKVTRNKK